jgi:beta-aspartyl-peptidase (threonine type)
MNASFSLMVHGGAGDLDRVKDRRIADLYLEGIQRALEEGRRILGRGGSALDAVEACACILEDNPLFNAGRGSVLNEAGRVEMDAGIMDGRNLAVGAVAVVSGIANPVRLARRVMSDSGHVLLIGDGAVRFARELGFELVANRYLVAEHRVAQLHRARAEGQVGLDHDEPDEGEEKHGTIGAIARDKEGNLAAATSTGGVVNKRTGRVGDSPIAGAGFYADNSTCAVSTTGHGEDFMRTLLAKTVADILDFTASDLQSALSQAMDYFRRKVAGRGGLILIDRLGNCASAQTTKRMIQGRIEHAGEMVCGF